jgi:hypothetical protein
MFTHPSLRPTQQQQYPNNIPKIRRGKAAASTAASHIHTVLTYKEVKNFSQSARRKMENHLVYESRVREIEGGSEAIYYREAEMMASMGHSLIDTHFYTHMCTWPYRKGFSEIYLLFFFIFTPYGLCVCAFRRPKKQRRLFSRYVNSPSVLEASGHSLRVCMRNFVHPFLHLDPPAYTLNNNNNNTQGKFCERRKLHIASSTEWR